MMMTCSNDSCGKELKYHWLELRAIKLTGYYQERTVWSVVSYCDMYCAAGAPAIATD